MSGVSDQACVAWIVVTHCVQLQLAAHTNSMELDKRRKHAERIELEKDIVTWHLAQATPRIQPPFPLLHRDNPISQCCRAALCESGILTASMCRASKTRRSHVGGCKGLSPTLRQ